METNFFAAMEGKNTSDAENSKLKSAFAKVQKSILRDIIDQAVDAKDFCRLLLEAAKTELENPPRRARIGAATAEKQHERKMILYGNEGEINISQPQKSIPTHPITGAVSRRLQRPVRQLFARVRG